MTRGGSVFLTSCAAVCTPGTDASNRTAASLSLRFSFFATNWITLPVASQLMQRHRPLPGVTRNDGFLSSWNGHRPTQSLPSRVNSTP